MYRPVQRLADPTIMPNQALVENSLIVKVHFDDLEMACRTAASFEPMESNYETGYLFLSIESAGYNRLLEFGLRVEIDSEPMLAAAADP